MHSDVPFKVAADIVARALIAIAITAERDQIRESVCSDAETVGYYGSDADDALTCFRRAIASLTAERDALQAGVDAVMKLAGSPAEAVQRRMNAAIAARRATGYAG